MLQIRKSKEPVDGRCCIEIYSAVTKEGAERIEIAGYHSEREVVFEQNLQLGCLGCGNDCAMYTKQSQKPISTCETLVECGFVSI